MTVDIEGYRDDLERIADETERSMNQLIRFFIKEGIEKNTRPTDSDIESQLVIQYLKKLFRGENLTNGEIMLLAKILQVPPRNVMHLKVNGNGESTINQVSQ